MVVVYTDAAMIPGRRGWRIGVVCADREGRYVTSQAADAFAAETWGTLKALEFALECHPDATEVEIRSDAQAAGGRTRHAQANRYVAALERLAADRGVRVRHAFVPGIANPADRVSRTESSRPAPAPYRSPFADLADPPVPTVGESDLLPEEVAAYRAIRDGTQGAAGRRKAFVKLRERVAARLGVASADAHPQGLGYVLQQAAAREG